MRLKGGSLWFLIAGFLLEACSTSVINDEPKPSDELQEYNLRIHISDHGFTRGGEIKEDAIASLTAVFLRENGSSIIVDKIIPASSVDNGQEGVKEFTISYSAFPGDFPDYLSVIVNRDIPTIEHNLEELTITDLTDNEGNMVMTSSRFYDTSNSNKNTYFSLLSAENFSASLPVKVYLERAAVKVTLTKSQTFKVNTPEMFYDGSKLTPQLHIQGWNVNCTDTKSYLIKNTGGLNFTNMETMLTGSESEWNWNTLTWESEPYPILHWAHSANWDMEAFPRAFTKTIDSEDLSILKYVEINLSAENEESNSVYVHETTRKQEQFGLPNALPCIVIAGYYTLNNTAKPVTFYRRGNELFTMEQLKKEIEETQEVLYEFSGSKLFKLDEYGLWNRIELVSNYENSVCNIPLNHSYLRIIPGNPYILDYCCDKGGNPYTEDDFEKVNDALLALGTFEKYDNGRCFFSFPIVHERPSMGTGHFGIVRNHHYDISLNSIEGFGNGVPDSELTLGDTGGTDPSVPDYDVQFELKVKDWNDTGIQDADIEAL